MSHVGVRLGFTLIGSCRVDYHRGVPTVDLLVLHSLNQFARGSRLFDSLVVVLVNANLLKGVVPMAILWGLWFQPAEATESARLLADRRRAQLLACCAIAIVAVLLARLLAHALPYRERPLHTPGIGYVLPYSMEPKSLIHWSSFPSDHAVLFFALAIGVLHFSRRWGALLIGHAALLISLPRIYLGIHWFTDILAGAVLGVALALVGMRSPLPRWMQRALDPLWQRHPAVCHAALFVLTYLIATLFDDARYIGSVLATVLGLSKTPAP